MFARIIAVRPNVVWSILAAGLVAWSLCWSLQAETPPLAAKAPFVRPQPLSGAARNDEGGKRLREGTRLIDVEGRFDSTGDRWAFFRADADESYKVLENLALERINKVLAETRASEKPQWIVSGLMTEYMGANYLLVSKAVIKAQPSDTADALPLNKRRGSAESSPAAEGKAGGP